MNLRYLCGQFSGIFCAIVQLKLQAQLGNYINLTKAAMTENPSLDKASTGCLKRTPLFECHQRAGAKFTEFGGWEMPVRYAGLSEEHHTVRNAVGLFDVSHMGELIVEGPGALNYLQRLTSNDVTKLFPGRAQYAMLLNESGGVVDDIIIYMFATEKYFICVNAGNIEKDVQWFTEHLTKDVFLTNVSTSFAQLAIQGPIARQLVCQVLGATSEDYSAENFKPFYFREEEKTFASFGRAELIVACTGYTGEDGFEIFLPAEAGPELWTEFLERGADFGIAPIGLGARDTLRLEVCYPLHGHELADDVCALWSNVSWAIKLKKKTEFIGQSALVKAQAEGLTKKLVGIEVQDRGIVRGEAQLYDGEQNIGWVTSGTQPPTVNKAVALAYVDAAKAEVGTSFSADVRGKRLAVQVVELPFYGKKI